MRPDPALAPAARAGPTRGMLANAYLRGGTPGRGIVGQTIQFHGTADRYTAGADVDRDALLDASTPTANPAVTLRSVGTTAAGSGLHLRPRALGRLHAPGQPGLGRAGARLRARPLIRSDDLFFGAKAGDVQPDWVDLNKVAIPQADEQQRLLADLIRA